MSGTITAKRKVTSKIDYFPVSQSTSSSSTNNAPQPTRPSIRSSPSIASFSRAQSSPHITTVSAPPPPLPSLPSSGNNSNKAGGSQQPIRARAKVNVGKPNNGVTSPPMTPGFGASGTGNYNASPLSSIGASYLNGNSSTGSSNKSDVGGGGGKSDIGSGAGGGSGSARATTSRRPPVISSSSITSINTDAADTMSGYRNTKKPTIARATTTPETLRERASFSSASSTISGTATPPTRAAKAPSFGRTPSSQSVMMSGNPNSPVTETPKSQQPYRTLNDQRDSGHPVRTYSTPGSTTRSPELVADTNTGGNGRFSVSPTSSAVSSHLSGMGTGRSGLNTGRGEKSASPRLAAFPGNAVASSSRMTTTSSSGSGSGYTNNSNTVTSRGGSSAYTNGISALMSLPTDMEEEDEDEGEPRMTEKEWRKLAGLDEFDEDMLKEETEEERGERERLELDREMAEDAKKDRKIADLEISNKSLMTINRTLEAAAARKDRLISNLKRQLRASERGGGDHIDLAFKPLKESRRKRSNTDPEGDRSFSSAEGGTGEGQDDSGNDTDSEIYSSDEDEGESFALRHASAIDEAFSKLNDTLAAMAKRGKDALDRVEKTTEGEKGKVLGVLDLQERDEAGDGASTDDGGGRTPEPKDFEHAVEYSVSVTEAA